MIQSTLIKLPNIKSRLEVSPNNPNSFSFVVEPLLPGFGNTLGNSIRRMLLSSIPGCGVTRVTIGDITHEYMGIEGVVEDAMNIILNLKQIRSKIKTDDDQVVIKLNKKKAGEIYVRDFDTQGIVEIANPDLYICTLSTDMDFSIEVEITRGVGYLSNDKINFAQNLNPNNILVDTIFSPIVGVSLDINPVRVGDRTDYDKLVLNFETDGTIDGKEVVVFILDFIVDLYQKMRSGLEVSLESSETVKSTKTVIKKNKTADLDLPEDLLLILEKNGISDKASLIEKKSEIEDFAGITKKHIKLVNEFLK